jgi:hypothetical protein
VPLDPTIRETSNTGTPITVAEPENPRVGLLPYGGPHWGQFAGEGADRRPPPRFVIE